MDRTLGAEVLLSRWEDRREIQNIIGRLTQSYLMMEEGQIFDRWWSSRADICLGVNDGWYAGRASVQGYYAALDAKIRLASRLMAACFPEKLGGKTEEELYGVGQIGIRPADTSVIEVASDGQTAKGIWSIHGTGTDITTAGPVSLWDWGYLCVDFVREGDSWKIWHLQDLHDINTPTGYDWTQPAHVFEDHPAFAEMADFAFPAPDVAMTLREAYYPGRPFAASPRLPEPYDTFAETFSYGMEA